MEPSPLSGGVHWFSSDTGEGKARGEEPDGAVDFTLVALILIASGVELTGTQPCHFARFISHSQAMPQSHCNQVQQSSSFTSS